MSILDKLSGAFSQAGTQAKKTFSATMLDMKIKAYTKEKTEIYIKLGKLLYTQHRHEINDRISEGLCNDIDNIKHRLNTLEKQRFTLKDDFAQPLPVAAEPFEKSEDKQELNKEATKEQKKFPRLNKKETDLMITRTREGIQILRFCPNCHTENNAHTSNCSHCEYTFK